MAGDCAVLMQTPGGIVLLPMPCTCAPGRHVSDKERVAIQCQHAWALPHERERTPQHVSELPRIICNSKRMHTVAVMSPSPAAPAAHVEGCWRSLSTGHGCAVRSRRMNSIDVLSPVPGSAGCTRGTKVEVSTARWHCKFERCRQAMDTQWTQPRTGARNYHDQLWRAGTPMF